MLDFLDNSTFKLMRKSLDVLAQRIEVTSQNISNVNTPGYKAKRLEFEDLLLNKLQKKDTLYSWRLRNKNSGADSVNSNSIDNIIETVSPQIYTDNSTEMKVDRNNVDIDHENLELARTQLQYNYMVRKITDEYNLIKTALE